MMRFALFCAGWRVLLATTACSAALQASPVLAADDAALYRDLGGQPGVAALVDDFTARLQDDPRTEPFFRDIDEPKFKSQMVAQFCELSGGPCKREGKDMATLHAEQEVRRRDFNAVVEVLQRSMDARGIAFSTQNRLLALLAPMHREIVNVH